MTESSCGASAVSHASPSLTMECNSKDLHAIEAHGAQHALQSGITLHVALFLGDHQQKILTEQL
jgi:hypothetical protein